MTSSPSPSAPRQPQQPPSQSGRWPQPGQPQPQQRPERGIPDGLVVGLLAVLLGTTALFWAATELGGLVSHGHFPHPLPFLSTAGAIRHLATAPNDLAGAWPGTPAASLPSPAAFWLTFFALLALVLLLLLSAAAARAKRRAAHDARVRVEGTPGTGNVVGPAGGRGAPFGPPGQRRGSASASAGHQAAVPAGRTPTPPPEPGIGFGSSGTTGGPSAPGGPDVPGVPGIPGGGHPDAITHAQTGRAGRGGAAASSWGAGPAASDPNTLGLDDASGEGSALGTASPWAPGGPATVTGPAADGRVVPQGNGGRGPSVPATVHPSEGLADGRRDATQSFGMPSVADPDIWFPAERSGAFPAEGAPTAPSGASVPRPGGSTAAGWAQRVGAADGIRSSRFVLPDVGTMCVFAPEAGSAGRRALMSAAVADAMSAPLVVVTADAELWATRPPHRRAARFDPQQLTDEEPETPRGRWAPHSGCAEAAVATARARALLLPTVRPVADAEEQGVRGLAETLLRCWLRAAALDGRPFRHVGRWAGGGSAGGGSGAGRQEAVAVLQSAATPADVGAGEEAWAGQLQAALLRPASTLEPALGRVRAALASVAELHVLAACTPESPAAAIDPVALLGDGTAGSLYILGHAGDGRLREPGSGSAAAVHSAMPLLSALVDDTVQRAWNTSARADATTPAPAPVFVLDDIAAVAPFPTLPQLMADGGARGLRAVTLLRSPEQARARWGERAVHSLWTTAGHRAILGPLSPAPLAALLASLGAAEHTVQQALGPDELLVLAGRHRTAPPQRFRIGPALG